MIALSAAAAGGYNASVKEGKPLDVLAIVVINIIIIVTIIIIIVIHYYHYHYY